MVGKMKIKKINTVLIEAAIENFEKQVDFEFVPVIAKKSSYVEHITWILSLLFLILFLGLTQFVFEKYFFDSWISSTPFYLAAPFCAFALAVIVDKSDRVDRFFISKAERVRQVQEKAELVFNKLRLGELKSENALLLYVSVMEKQIVLLPDPRLEYEKMKEIDEQLLKILQESFKKSDFETGLIKAIEHLKQCLAHDFSKKSAVDNKVPNKLIWWHD